MKKRSAIYCLIVSLAWIGCSNNSGSFAGYTQMDKNAKTSGDKGGLQLKPVEYVKWVEDSQNGLAVEKQIGEYKFSALYKPLEYVVLKEKRDANISGEAMKRSVEEISDLQYFTFKIGLNDGSADPLSFGVSSNEDFQQRVEYFSFRMQGDLKLVDNKDTLGCMLYHFERTYGITPYCTFVLGFEKNTNEASDKVLVYNDQLLGVGPVKMMIGSENLKRIPKLITL